MTILWISLALLMGASATIQPTLNNRLAQHAGITTAVLVSSVLVLICSVIYYFVSAEPDRPGLGSLMDVPWYLLTGGVFGFAFVLISVLCFPRLGASLTFALSTAAMFGLAVVVDHWGLLGMPEHPVTWPRIIGLALLGAGATLIKIY